MNTRCVLSGKGILSASKALQLIAQLWRKGLFLILSILALLSLTGCVSNIATHVTFRPNEEWRAEIRLSFTPQQLMLIGGEQALEAKLKEETTKLEARNIHYAWKKEPQKDGSLSCIIAVEGKGLQDFNQAVFNKIYVAELLGGPASLHLSGDVVQEHVGQTLVIKLQSNPSTGYEWEVTGIDKQILHQVGKIEFEQESQLLGSLGKQILRFEVVGAGQTILKLNYHRPWEKDAEPTRIIAIQAVGLDLFDLFTQLNTPTSTSTPVITQEREITRTVTIPQVGEHSTASLNSSLPAAFDWRAQGKVTPIRDQGGCGSCWAFGTVGPFESKIMIEGGAERDLSEQYLVSCNTDGWGCSGGWWAHDYHWNKRPPSEPEAGAVSEQEFPYEGEDVSCRGPYQHPYKINSWSCIGNASPPDCCTGNILPTEAIKQAIYTYGPVSAAVCAGSAFQNYRSGVFETNEAGACQSSAVNHGIVLVGWDDNQGANGVWILRNSWGSGWGENGYMRIGYGISNVGSCASYIVYPGCPSGQFKAEYYNNRYLSGSPTFTRCDGSINYDWGGGGPGNGIGNDNFSVRWTGRFNFSGGNYTFIARADDGIRVWVDGNLLIDAWRDQAPTEYRANRSLSSGEHEVKVEYYENGGGAVAQVRWEQTGSSRIGVTYQAHVEGIGWMGWVSNGDIAGTTGQSRRMEAVRIQLVNAPAGVRVTYQAHVEGIGWMDWVWDGAVAGTTGRSLRMEAVRIRLVNAPSGYGITYQAHVEGMGWMNWVSNGDVAGTTGQSRRMEAIRIQITGP